MKNKSGSLDKIPVSTDRTTDKSLGISEWYDAIFYMDEFDLAKLDGNLENLKTYDMKTKCRSSFDVDALNGVKPQADKTTKLSAAEEYMIRTETSVPLRTVYCTSKKQIAKRRTINDAWKENNPTGMAVIHLVQKDELEAFKIAFAKLKHPCWETEEFNEDQRRLSWYGAQRIANGTKEVSYTLGTYSERNRSQMRVMKN